MFDVHGELAHHHVMERRRAADEHRLRMLAAGPGTRPSALVRLYTRLWWASRPRTAAWAPGRPELRY